MSRFVTPKRYVNPATKANETLSKCGTPRMPNGCAIDVEHIARVFCKVELMFIAGLNPSGKPLLGLFSPTFNAIMVESDCMEVRQRFTIAHEIGHIELEHEQGNAKPLFELDQQETFECTEDDEKLGVMEDSKAGVRRRREIRANQFAASLLMPEGLVREVWRKEQRDRDRVANTLLVSKEALGYRLADLQLA